MKSKSNGRSVDPLKHLWEGLIKGLDSATQKKLWPLIKRLPMEWAACKANTLALRQSRDRLAATLCEIRTLLAKEGLFQRVCDACGLPRRSAYDLIEDHERIAGLNLPPAVKKAAENAHIDLTAKKMAPAIEQHKRKLKAATTRESAEKVIEMVKAGSKRRCNRIETPPEQILEESLQQGITRVQSFLANHEKDADFIARLTGVINQIAEDFGFRATLVPIKKAPESDALAGLETRAQA